MASSDRYLRTQQVASALGVSVSTIKRWVDLGMIRAARTVGKHRLIPMSEAIRIATEHGVDASKIERLSGSANAEVADIDEQTCETLTALLREGKVNQAKLLIQSTYSSGCGAVTLADKLIRPVMQRIGHGWLVGALDIYQEHQASHALAGSIQELIERTKKVEAYSEGLALGATTEGDPYVLSSLLGELVLREMGWDVRHLGVNLPLGSLANAVTQYRPKLIFLSVNFLRDEAQFVRDYLSFFERAAAMNAAVIVGGHALGPELRSKLVYAAFGDRMAHLAEFARRLGHPKPASDPKTNYVSSGPIRHASWPASGLG